MIYVYDTVVYGDRDQFYQKVYFIYIFLIYIIYKFFWS